MVVMHCKPCIFLQLCNIQYPTHFIENVLENKSKLKAISDTFENNIYGTIHWHK